MKVMLELLLSHGFIVCSDEPSSKILNHPTIAYRVDIYEDGVWLDSLGRGGLGPVSLKELLSQLAIELSEAPVQ